ncbi:uncharacterized protein [Montipora foliosa]
MLSSDKDNLSVEENLCEEANLELTSNFILEMKVHDKHHVGLSSTNMEKEAFKKIARRRLSNMLKVVEVASDASASIKKLIDRTGKRNGKDQGLGRPYTVIQHFLVLQQC